jgi:hypothetical protein
LKHIGNSDEEDEVLRALLLRERVEFAATTAEIPYIRAHLGAVLLNEFHLGTIRENRKIHVTYQGMGRRTGIGRLAYT